MIADQDLKKAVVLISAAKALGEVVECPRKRKEQEDAKKVAGVVLVVCGCFLLFGGMEG